MTDNNITISICITQYNEDINNLLNTLCQEIDSYQLPCNIHIRNDNSNQNNPVNVERSYLNIHRNKQNLGRAANRNKLIEDAIGSFILFLDGDVIPADKRFLRSYIRLINTEYVRVVSGGIKYTASRPSSNYRIHYKYGALRESKSKKHLKTSNLLIERQLIDQMKFDENISHYGHEDTLLSYQLQERQIKIHLVDNPIIHTGLLTNKQFLDKQDEALKALVSLEMRGYSGLTELQTAYRKYNSHYVFQFFSVIGLSSFLRSLLFVFPYSPLRILDAYKLLKYHSLLSEKGKM